MVHRVDLSSLGWHDSRGGDGYGSLDLAAPALADYDSRNSADGVPEVLLSPEPKLLQILWLEAEEITKIRN